MKYLRLSDVIVGATSSELRFWDIKTSLVIRRHAVPGKITNIAANPSLSLVAVGTELGFVRLYAVNTLHAQAPTLVMKARVHSKPVTELSFDSSGRYLTSSSEDGYIYLYDTAKDFCPLGYLWVDGKVKGTSWIWEEEEDNLACVLLRLIEVITVLQNSVSRQKTNPSSYCTFLYWQLIKIIRTAMFTALESRMKKT